MKSKACARLERREKLQRLDLFHHRAGRLSSAPLSAPTESTPYLVLPHARIEAVLEAEALATGRVRIHRGARVTEVLVRGGRLCGVRHRSRRGQGHAWARLLVGADGGRSLVRRVLGIEATPHRYDHAYLGLEADRPEGYADALSPEACLTTGARPVAHVVVDVFPVPAIPTWTIIPESIPGHAMDAPSMRDDSRSAHTML